ncbi:MAG: hypothetical protein ACTSYL_02295 [Candidatus Thorarchaeota archaeon]
MLRGEIEVFWETADKVILREVESVRARRIILEEIEKGPKTGSELREKIREDMIEQARQRGAKRVGKMTVTDPKLYFNTKHLEEVGIIVSKKESQQRVFSLAPHATQAVRRVLNVTRNTTVISSISRPEEVRSLVYWFTQEAEQHFNRLRLVVEKERFGKGVTKDLTRHVPDGTTKRWEGIWDEVPKDIAGYYDGGIPGNLMATYAFVEKILLEEIPDRNVVFDLSNAPPVIGLAFSLLSNDYAVTAIYIHRHKARQTTITHYIPGRGLL